MNIIHVVPLTEPVWPGAPLPWRPAELGARLVGPAGQRAGPGGRPTQPPPSSWLSPCPDDPSPPSSYALHTHRGGTHSTDRFINDFTGGVFGTQTNYLSHLVSKALQVLQSPVSSAN